MIRLIVFLQGGSGRPGLLITLLPYIIIGIVVVISFRKYLAKAVRPHTEVGIDELRSPVVNRYQDAYRVGTALVGLGNTIKVVGVVLAGIIVLGSLSAGNSLFGGGAVLALTFLAAIVGGLFWVCGVIVAAQGQILQATLDNAVASSHFLTNPERADAMGLPRSVADRSGAYRNNNAD